MMASQGLTTTDGSESGGREPGLSSRVKQSCRLLNVVLRASDRSRSENSRQQAIDRPRIRGCSILLNHPMNRVSAARGMRLVKRKFRSSCCDRTAMRPRIVMNLSAVLGSACRHGFASSDSLSRRCCGDRYSCDISQIAGAPGAVARQARLVDRTCQDVAPGGAADPVL